MRVIFYSFEPFAFAHDEKQEQIVHTRDALRELNVEVEYLRWYDERQSGDVLHFFGRITMDLLDLARESGMKVVVTDWLTKQAAYSRPRLGLQRWIMQILMGFLPGAVTETFHWRSYQLADACIVRTQAEADLLSVLFGASPEKVHVVSNGMDVVFLNTPAPSNGPKSAVWLDEARQLRGIYEKLLRIEDAAAKTYDNDKR